MCATNVSCPRSLMSTSRRFARRWPRPDDQHERVAIKFDGFKLALLRQIGNHADIEMMIHDLAWHVAGKHSMNLHMNSGMNLPVTRERRQQRVNRTLVHAERNLAAFQSTQFLHAFADFFAQIQHAVGVFNEQQAGVGQRLRARAANEQRLAHPLLELPNGYAHGGLRPVKLFGCAGKTLLAYHRLKHLQRGQIHGFPLEKTISLYKRDLSSLQPL